eukprot:scaffold107609_cov17-Prasinocladus_malaysianus.AAC.1
MTPVEPRDPAGAPEVSVDNKAPPRLLWGYRTDTGSLGILLSTAYGYSWNAHDRYQLTKRIFCKQCPPAHKQCRAEKRDQIYGWIEKI